MNEIRTAIDEDRLDEAWFLLRKELEMPYIPAEAEEAFLKLKQEISYRMSEQHETKELSLDALLKRLKGKPQTQLAAAAKLADRNLRSCINEIRDWLSKDPQPEAAAMIIEALAEQEINEEFTFTRDGVEYTFSPDMITPVDQSEGFRLALSCLNEWMGKYPAMLEMARMTLIHEAYMYLPLNYEAEEAITVAEGIANEVCRLMNDEESTDEISRMITESRQKQA